MCRSSFDKFIKLICIAVKSDTGILSTDYKPKLSFSAKKEHIPLSRVPLGIIFVFAGVLAGMAFPN